MPYELLDSAPSGRYELLDDAPVGKTEAAGNPLRAGLRSISPLMSSILENPQAAMQGAKQLAMGGARGVKDVLDTGAQWAAQGFDKLAGTSEGERVKAMNDAGKEQFKRDYKNQSGASIGRIGGQILSTAPVAPLLGAGAGALGFGKLGQALSSYGMSTGGAAPGFLGGLSDLALRSGAGALVGGAQAALVNPDDAPMGAIIGGAAPGAFQLAGKIGGAAANAFSTRGNAGKTLARALDATPEEIASIINAAKAAPESLVDGSRLTLSQALQSQGANKGSVKMLERIATAGPGGNVLVDRYADQGAARLEALRAQGAQAYDGAAREEANRAGNQIGALLRTQAADEQAAARAAWQGSPGSSGGVYGRAREEGIALQFPLDRMKQAMEPLGKGSVMPGADARRVLDTANEIGTDLLPGLKPIPMSAGKTQNLEQAVRSAGGIKKGDYLGKEISELGRKQSATTGLISQYGRDVESMATNMHERGFLPNDDPATLIDMLRNGGGRKVYASDHVEAGFQRMAEHAAGDMPTAERIPKAVPFDEFQRLRRDSGSLAAKASDRAGNETEAGVLTNFQKLLSGRVDDAAAGNLLAGEHMTPGFASDYNAAREGTRQFHERYSGGNNISQILRKPVGQNFTLGGDEITNKLWHGGAGLQDDVRNLKNVLSANNYDPAIKSLQQLIMTDAASKTKGSGNLGAALPRYVENRMPGLMEALNPDQLKALTGVASDIRNSDAAAAVPGLLGSDTYAKASRAMSGGLLDSPSVKTISKLLSIKGIGAESIRVKGAEMVMGYKGRTVSELMANPKAAAAALQDINFTRSLDGPALQALRLAAAQVAPVLATSP